MISITLNDYGNVCNSCTIYVVLFVIVFLIIISIASLFYCHNFETIPIDDFWHHSISLLSKSFSNTVFANWKDQTINSVPLDLLGRQKSILQSYVAHDFKVVSIFNTCLINNIFCFISNLFDLKLKILNLNCQESCSLHFENIFSSDTPKILFGKKINLS